MAANIANGKDGISDLTENSVEKDALLSQDEFLKKYNFSLAAFKGTGLSWEALENIHQDYIASQGLLQDTLTRITSKFLTNDAKDAGVHSVRSRLKSSEGLIEKIIRKAIEAAKKSEKFSVSIDNYHEIITDLIGIRVLHTFKEDWFGIHNYILGQLKFLTKETPTIYYRKGDDRRIINECKKHGCNAVSHPKGYRSIHYVINPQPNKNICFAEIQVRTVFEDGWSEIDHKLRYVTKKGDKHILDSYLLALNRIAGSADEIGSLIKNRQIEIRRQEYSNQLNKDREKK